ncbi:transferase hexapeptide repeat containing protein [Desulfobulbus propionicus DSM 2032]|uniref:Transferase hexapeptide repeat containing protein n=1 Tax=Desulfobulbus propionicus (strain ATCC 33891 / DSM 2032 / VKM B-1956 / 1pr3) TaxID=577650 RepID=A0A7U3YKF4_DESPD|nr:transferase hexapeptide repeat containing protein [Desulfobulbus propionicus]ADW17030.1 transferase hexapeptide repeat containing protein [Desulfobulbus propionicus DSM 2032]
MLTPGSFFDLTDFPDPDLFAECPYVWDPLKKLKAYVASHTAPTFQHVCITDGVPLDSPYLWFNGKLRNARECIITYNDTTKGGLTVWENGQFLEGASVIMAGAVLVGKNIKIGRGVLIESGAMIKSPAIIGDCSEVRQGAYLRGYCLIGKRCVVGHTTEVKHTVFLNDAKAGHFAYLGDSILGNRVNLGAGTKCANLRFVAGTIPIRTASGRLDTGLRKFGAIIGDGAQTGCNAVTSPGTIMGPESLLLPNATAPSGLHPRKSVIR